MTYSIVFEVKQLEIVLNALASFPYNQVSPTIESVKKQIEEQNQLAEAKAETLEYDESVKSKKKGGGLG